MSDDRRRHRRDDAHGPTADELRRRLVEQAGHAPAGDFLAERVIARAEAAERNGKPPVSVWGRLLAVAAAIIVVAGIGTIVLVVASDDGKPNRDQAANSLTPPPTPPPSTRTVTEAPETTTSTPAPQTSQTRQITVPTLTNVKIADVTFTANDNGWAVGTADCLQSSGTCSALLHTDDGGKSWDSRPGTPFNVAADGASCASRCVSHVRFATDDIGYAFSRTALFLTTDGAKNWRKLDGGADALETLDGNVIKVSSDAGSCPPGCDYRVQVADFGSTDWRTVDLPGSSSAGVGVTLSRTGSSAYLLATGNPAGGAQRATSTLWTSNDDGGSWRNRGEPCTQRGGEVDAGELTTAADGTVVVTCQLRAAGRQAVAVSTDGGKSFDMGQFALGGAAVTAVGAANSHIALVSSDTTYRTIDGGGRFVRSRDLGQVSYLGFASDTDAHAIAADGRTIFTTTDAGRTWKSAEFR